LGGEDAKEQKKDHHALPLRQLEGGACSMVFAVSNVTPQSG
jgi:hypothetical protein